jgi:hypothetical protein
MRTKELNVNPSQFIKITTPEVAYILGFLWADGFLGAGYSINAEIVSDDAIILEKIFLSTGKWHIFQRHRKGFRASTKFTCNSKLLYEYLIDLGFNAKNKSPDKLLKTIPKKLRSYWFRGYFDGDGCWYFNSQNYLKQCTITSKYCQDWNFMIQLFIGLKVDLYNINKQDKKNKKGIKNTSSRIRLCNLNSIKKFGKYIYKGQAFGLNRKLDKFNEMIQ